MIVQLHKVMRTYQIKPKQLVIHKKNQAPSSYIKSFTHLNLKSKQTQKIQLTLALLQPWNHKPLLDDCQCEQKQKPINLKSSKVYNIQQNHENIKNRSQIFFTLCHLKDLNGLLAKSTTYRGLG